MTRKPRTNRSKTPRRADAGIDLQQKLGKIEPGPISLIDASGTILSTGSGVVRLLGYLPGEREGQGIFELIHPDDQQVAREAFADLVREPGAGLATDVRCLAKDGTYRLLEVAAVNRLNDPDVRAIVVTYRDVTDRRVTEARARASEQAQAALADREMLLRTIVDASPECLKVIAADGAVLQMNPAGLMMLDATGVAELPNPISGVVAPEHRRAFENMAARVFAGHPTQLQFEIIGLKGSRRWVESHAVRLTYPGRSEPVMVAVTRDITQRKQAEDALRESEKLYRTLFVSAPIGLGIADQDGNLLAFNDAICAPGGYTEADIRAIGNVARLYASAEQRERMLAQARAEGRLHREPVRFLRKDHSVYDALMSLEPVEIGGRRGWLAVVEDVSQKKLAEAAERQAQERYQTFFEHSPQAFCRFELDQPCSSSLSGEQQVAHLYRHAILAECNGSMARMYGFESPSEIVDRSLGDLLGRGNPDHDAAVLAFINAEYQQTNLEIHEHDREGVPRVYLRNLVGIVEEGSLRRVWGTQRDITEQKHLEDQLRQAQKMEAIGRLAGGVAHDFNNLLTAMLGSAEMLLAGLGPADPRLEDASDIKHAAARAAALTRQLLAFGRRQVLKAQALNLNRVVSDMQRLLRRLIPEDIELVTRRADDLWTVLADRSQLEQVLVNLVVNARDAMPDGGVVMIETANVQLDALFAARNPGSSAGPHVALTVRDTGRGMDAETRAHIFEPFFTTKEVGKGTGLGLATVYGIVKQSGGYISVQSELKVGTSFQILLPRSLASAGSADTSQAGGAEGEAEAPVADLRGGTETILIAEDEERIRVSAKRILEYYGYRVLLAPDGQAALELLNETPVDLVVSDVVMPRMNGTQLYDAVRQRGSGVRFLFTSGYVGREGRSDVTLDPAVPFLPKPWTVDELINSVREILDVKK